LNPTQRDQIRTVVKEVITSIKPLDNGAEDFSDDAPLFDEKGGEPSPVGLDSLDMLDLALAIGERFGLPEERLDRLLSEETDIQSLRTVNDIVDFIVAASPRLVAEGTDTIISSEGDGE
jgi:acyl carrier protein